MKNNILITAVFVLAAALARAQEKPEAGGLAASSFIELLRSDIKAQKVQLISEGMNLPEEYSAAFWPVYRKYQYELDVLNDELFGVLKDYASHYENLSSQKAAELAKKSFDLQEKKLRLRKSYYEEFNKTLPPKMAARYAQLDNRINLLLDLQLASRIPLVKDN